MKRSFIFLAHGFEEIEAITTLDVLRRAGMDVKTVSITAQKQVVGAHGLEIMTDLLWSQADFNDAEFLILPGGLPGATNLYECENLQNVIVEHNAKGGKIAAICASPAVVLAPLGVLRDREATCYPGFEDALRAGGALACDVPVVALDTVITANGPATSLRFALAIVANVFGVTTADQVGSQMLFFPNSMNTFL